MAIDPQLTVNYERRVVYLPPMDYVTPSSSESSLTFPEENKSPVDVPKYYRCSIVECKCTEDPVGEEIKRFKNETLKFKRTKPTEDDIAIFLGNKEVYDQLYKRLSIKGLVLIILHYREHHPCEQFKNVVVRNFISDPNILWCNFPAEMELKQLFERKIIRKRTVDRPEIVEEIVHWLWCVKKWKKEYVWRNEYTDYIEYCAEQTDNFRCKVGYNTAAKILRNGKFRTFTVYHSFVNIDGITICGVFNDVYLINPAAYVQPQIHF